LQRVNTTFPFPCELSSAFRWPARSSQVSFPPWNLLGFDLCTNLSILNWLDFVLVSISHKWKVFFLFEPWSFVCRQPTLLHLHPCFCYKRLVFHFPLVHVCVYFYIFLAFFIRKIMIFDKFWIKFIFIIRWVAC